MRKDSTNSTKNSSDLKSTTTGVKPTLSNAQSLVLKEKQRWQRIKRIYGIDQEQYAKLDKGHCPICLRTWGGTVRPAVDHDHVDGYVRGIVCLYCNRTRIGRFRDAELVRRIAKYLDGPFEHVVPPKPKKKRKKRIK